MAGEDGDEDRVEFMPETMAKIAELSPRLANISSLLSMVPVFTATVNNATTPLTVVTPEGGRMPYFFLEYADAVLFQKAVTEQTKLETPTQVITLSLADIIDAYAGPEAVAAKESFVVIPTMPAVVRARKLLRKRGATDEQLNSVLGRVRPGSVCGRRRRVLLC